MTLPSLTTSESASAGTPRKLVDVSRLTALGWIAKTPLREGLRLAYQAYLSQSSTH
jgi:GDP-L-fucose synthase